MPRTSQNLLLFVALCLVGLVRLAPHYNRTGSLPEGEEAVRVGRSLAFRGQFANPFRTIDTGPSAHVSPGYPVFLAVLILAFGTGAWGLYMFQLAAAAALAMQLALLPALSEALGIGLWPGLLGCLIGLAAPMRTFPDWEASYAGLLAAMVTVFWLRVLNRDVGRPRDSWMLGITAGLLLLTSAATFAVLAVWAVYFVWTFRSNLQSRTRWAALVIPIFMLLPWTIRNYIVFHRLVVFRSNLGLELAVSNNDCASTGIRQNISSRCYIKLHPNWNLEEARTLRALGEPQYNAIRLKQTVDWITRHPRRFTSLTLDRIVAFWFPFERESPLQQLTLQGRRRERLIIYVMTILSVIGLVRLTRHNPLAGVSLLSWLLCFPLIYYIVQFEDRYRYPIMWVTLLTGSYALCNVTHFLRAVSCQDVYGSDGQYNARHN